ncbi:MAG: LuxR family transcriptional regulator [Chitinophagaceae bacterium]|nr:MAG: LuxR family transcriptional regulator [Chitinophagaceae bacterium]
MQIKTPLNNLLEYLEKYIEISEPQEEFKLFKASIQKLFADLDHLTNTGYYTQKYSVSSEFIIANLSTVLKECLGLLNNTLQKAILSTPTPGNTQASNWQIYKHYNLTPREIEITAFIQQALSNKEIAKILFISERTVGKHVENLFLKVGVSNKIQLINKLKSRV